MYNILAFINTRSISVLSHVALGGIWALILLIVRAFFPEYIKDTVLFSSSFVFFSFILSLGFTTLSRLLIYERKVFVLRLIISLSLVLSLILCAISIIISDRFYFYLLSSVGIYNAVFLYLNICIATKNYYRIIFYSMASIFTILLCFISYFNDYYIVFCVYLIGWILFSILHINIHTFLEMFRKIDFYFVEIIRAPVLLLAISPLRVCIYLLGLLFSSTEIADIDTILYSELLIFQGFISIIIGRIILFNEKIIKNKFGSYTGLFLIIQLAITIIFSVYSLLAGAENIFLIVLSVLLLSSRESFGAFVNLSRKNIMYVVCFIYTLLTVISFVLYSLGFSYYYYAYVFAFPFLLNTLYYSLYRSKYF